MKEVIFCFFISVLNSVHLGCIYFIMENRNTMGLNSCPPVEVCWPIDDGFQNYLSTHYYSVEIKDLVLFYFISKGK